MKGIWVRLQVALEISENPPMYNLTTPTVSMSPKDIADFCTLLESSKDVKHSIFLDVLYWHGTCFGSGYNLHAQRKRKS